MSKIFREQVWRKGKYEYEVFTRLYFKKNFASRQFFLSEFADRSGIVEHTYSRFFGGSCGHQFIAMSNIEFFVCVFLPVLF